MKTLLLLIHADEGQEARLQVALGLARALGGHLLCVDVVAAPTLARDPTGLAVGPILAMETVRAGDNKIRLEERLAREGVCWTWVDAAGSVAECLLDHAGLADLIIVNSKRDHALGLDARAVVGAVAMKARCPVLAVPDDLRDFDPLGEAVVGWDGSAPAMATLRASMPLLKLARRVRLVSVDDGGEAPRATIDDARRYLGWYGVEAEVRHIVGTTPDAALLSCAQLDKAAYCLIGAYGHGRWREDLLGGVTRRMLEAQAVPLLLGR